MKSVFSLLVLLGIIIGPDFSHSAQNCKIILTAPLESRPSFRLKRPQGISEDGVRYNTKDRLDIHVLNESGRVVGSLMGSVHNNLYYDFFFDINEPYQRRGISGDFFKLFFKKFPKTRPVNSMLISDNLEIFLDALDEGLSNEEAATATPHVRALSRIGYALTDVLYVDDEDLEVRVLMSPTQD